MKILSFAAVVAVVVFQQAGDVVFNLAVNLPVLRLRSILPG